MGGQSGLRAYSSTADTFIGPSNADVIYPPIPESEEQSPPVATDRLGRRVANSDWT